MRIAIYNNDPMLASFIGSSLSQAGHRAFVQTSRYNLVALLDRSTMDVVITDWYGASGEVTTSQHWLIRETKKTAVVFTIELGAATPRLRANDSAYPIAFIALPSSQGQLTRQVDSVIRQAFPWRQLSEVNVGPYSLNLLRRSVKLNDAEIPQLNEAKFRLAYCLFANLRRPLSRDYVKEFIGGAPGRGDSRYLDTLVSKIRVGLKLQGERGLWIRSLYGFGYVLEPVD